MRIAIDVRDLETWIGHEFVSDWLLIDQARIDAFAHATGDLNWVHVDTERARAFRGFTIAHGLLTASLLPQFWYQMYEITGVQEAFNYGFENVRFTAMVPVDSRLRLRLKILDISSRNGGKIVRQGLRFEREGMEKPVCVGVSLLAVFPDAESPV